MYHLFLDCTYKWYHTIFIFLCLTYFTQYDNLWVHPCCYKWNYFILFDCWVILHCIYVPLLYPFLCWWTLVCFPVCIEHWVHISFQTMFFSGYMPRSGIVWSYGSSIFSFLSSLQLLSIVAVPVYISTSNVGEVPSLHTISSIYCLWIFFDDSQAWYLIVLICISLIIFSCASWPSVCHLWRNVYLGHIFLLHCLFWWYSVAWAIYKFWRLTSCHSHHLQVFSPNPWVVFSFCCYGFLCCAKALNLTRSHLSVFVFIAITLGDRFNKILLFLMSECCTYVFLQDFIISGLTFRSLIHSELILRYGFNFIILYIAVQFPQHCVLKKLSFPHCIALPPVL